MERHCVLVATFLLMLHIVHAQDQIGTYKFVTSINICIYGFIDYKSLFL